MSDSYMNAAFEQVCADAKPAEGYYVTLMMRTQRYGGPEEGGWWRTDTHIVSYKYFSTEVAATLARDAVQTLANKMQADARKTHGDQMLSEMDMLESRGLEADYLPEPDGPDEYYVEMSEGLPTEYRSPSHYE